MTDHSIKGKVVIIAGGAKNLGGLIARDLAAQGAKAIAIHYNSAATKPDADATVAAIKAAGAEAVAIQADLTTAGAMEKLFADAVAAIGRPDIAINTVGKVLKKPIIEISESEYDEMSAVNAKSAFFFIKEAGKHLNTHRDQRTVPHTQLMTLTVGINDMYRISSSNNNSNNMLLFLNNLRIVSSILNIKHRSHNILPPTVCNSVVLINLWVQL